jgi:hypothetical protein
MEIKHKVIIALLVLAILISMISIGMKLFPTFLSAIILFKRFPKEFL